MLMKSKISVILALSLLFLSTAGAQAPDPTKWTFESKKVGQDLYDINITVTVDPPWHIYSQFLASGGPIPTKISLAKNPMVTLVGKPKESGKAVKQREEVFDIDVTYFAGKVNFVQRVKKKAGIKTNVSGSVTYMVCKEGECLPITTKDFTLMLK